MLVCRDNFKGFSSSPSDFNAKLPEGGVGESEGLG